MSGALATDNCHFKTGSNGGFAVVFNTYLKNNKAASTAANFVGCLNNGLTSYWDGNFDGHEYAYDHTCGPTANDCSLVSTSSEFLSTISSFCHNDEVITAKTLAEIAGLSDD
jgi:hypothetical protein